MSPFNWLVVFIGYDWPFVFFSRLSFFFFFFPSRMIQPCVIECHLIESSLKTVGEGLEKGWRGRVIDYLKSVVHCMGQRLNAHMLGVW